MRTAVTYRYILRTCGIGLCLLILLSCEEPVELDIEIPKSRLVINSNFFPDETVKLRVAATRPTGSAPIEISDAQVSLFEGTELAERLTYTRGSDGERGVYSTRLFKPVVGRKYTVHVTATGFDPVTAVSSIPDPVSIGFINVSGLSSAVSDGEAIYDYNLEVGYDDPEQATNYYDLRISQMVIPYQIAYNGDTIRMGQYVKSVNTPGRFSTGGSSVSLLIKDTPVDGPVQVHLQSRIDPSREILGDVIAELRTVSPEYYFYQLSLSNEMGTPDGGLNEPVIIYNNVDSGLGIFAGYNSVQRNFSLTK